MAKIWDDLKSNVKVWSSVAVEKAEEVSKVAVAKTEELTKLSKIKLDIHNIQREVKKETYLFGKFVFSQANESNIVNFAGNNEFLNYLEKIEDLQNQISSKELEIENIKSEFNIEILTNPYVTPNNKDLNSILNYEEIVSKIEKIAYLKHHELLEDLAENIFNMIFKNKLVTKINLKIEKLDILKKTKSVGIEVSKSKV